MAGMSVAERSDTIGGQVCPILLKSGKGPIYAICVGFAAVACIWHDGERCSHPKSLRKPPRRPDTKPCGDGRQLGTRMPEES